MGLLGSSRWPRLLGVLRLAQSSFSNAGLISAVARCAGGAVAPVGLGPWGWRRAGALAGGLAASVGGRRLARGRRRPVGVGAVAAGAQRLGQAARLEVGPCRRAWRRRLGLPLGAGAVALPRGRRRLAGGCRSASGAAPRCSAPGPARAERSWAAAHRV